MDLRKFFSRFKTTWDENTLWKLVAPTNKPLHATHTPYSRLPASQRVGGIPELIEHILLFTDPSTRFARATRVCRLWTGLITSSRTLQTRVGSRAKKIQAGSAITSQKLPQHRRADVNEILFEIFKPFCGFDGRTVWEKGPLRYHSLSAVHRPSCLQRLRRILDCPTATWRRMQAFDPPIQRIGFIELQDTIPGASKSVRCATVEFPRGVTMGALFDFVVQVVASQLAVFTLCDIDQIDHIPRPNTLSKEESRRVASHVATLNVSKVFVLRPLQGSLMWAGYLYEVGAVPPSYIRSGPVSVNLCTGVHSEEMKERGRDVPGLIP